MATTNNCNVCLDQLLEPDAPEELIVVNNQGSPSLFENGITNLAANVQSATVQFTTQKLSSQYTFNELGIENTLDASPLTILPTLVSHSTIGFSVVLNGITDTANYKLRWEVNVIEV